jgi:hypothetical protein
MPLNVAGQVPGKLSVCWNCGSEFTMSEELMDIDEPICHECKGDVPDIDDYLKNKLKTAM